MRANPALEFIKGITASGFQMSDGSTGHTCTTITVFTACDSRSMSHLICTKINTAPNMVSKRFYFLELAGQSTASLGFTAEL
jgi:hypothetical protein